MPHLLPNSLSKFSDMGQYRNTYLYDLGDLLWENVKKLDVLWNACSLVFVGEVGESEVRYHN